MFPPLPDAAGKPREARVQIQKTFEIAAKDRLELELRLDKFGEALSARGGRILDVSRGDPVSGKHLASVRYSLTLPAAVRQPPACVEDRGRSAA